MNNFVIFFGEGSGAVANKTRMFTNDGWLVVTQDGKPAVHFEKTVAITEAGPVLVSAEPGRDRPL